MACRLPPAALAFLLIAGPAFGQAGNSDNRETHKPPAKPAAGKGDAPDVPAAVRLVLDRTKQLR